MSVQSNANEPAFPLGPGNGVYGGLSKREWFAGMAMIGNVANSDTMMRPTSQKQVAEWSVQLADALLAELAELAKPEAEAAS